MSFNTTSLPSNSSTSPRTQAIRRTPSNSSWKGFPSRSYSGGLSTDSGATKSFFNTPGSALDSDRSKKLDDNIKNSKPFPLANEWTFYHDKFVANATPGEYEDNLKSVATVATVQNFWAVYNNILGPETLQTRSSLHFMKAGIRPVWEDPQNENGGAWSFRVNKNNTAVVWRELLMLLIGEQFEECVGLDDDIFGLTVSSRYNSDIFTIWNKNADAHDKAQVVNQLTDALKPIELQSPYYKAHRDHADFKKADITPTSPNGQSGTQ
ncbi:hypothetical protein G9A89_008772 [Geosiphon pyriformis]|nr:hypothetical protein G9A89_008772 [Geosiphon pyriformis]